jgi:hypothetical protein
MFTSLRLSEEKLSVVMPIILTIARSINRRIMVQDGLDNK